jgi:serine/threonine-protein kinase HipA
VAKEAGLKGPEDAFALLEWLGAESAGSLTLLPPGKEIPAAGALQPLSHEELSRRISALPRATLASGAPKRMSLAGAQHKLLVNYVDGQLYEPVGATASTHILKPNHPDPRQFPASVFNEFFTMRLAKASGLVIPNVEMLYVPAPVYIIKRFDRKEVKGQPPQRTHIIDACQLLNKARTFKHRGATLDALNEVAERCTDRALTRLRLFLWLVFNVLVGNDDCHLKNLSFNVTSEGITLAPHYDLLSTGAYWTKAIAEEHARWPTVPMAFELPGAKVFGQVKRATILETAEILQVPARTATRMLDATLRAFNAALAPLVEEFAKRRDAVPEDAKRFLGMQQRVLDVVLKMTYPEMTKALSE